MTSTGLLLELRADGIGLLVASLRLQPQRRLGAGLDDADDEERRQRLGQVHAAPVEVRQDEHGEHARHGEPDRRHKLVERHELWTVLARHDLAQVAQGHRELRPQTQAQHEAHGEQVVDVGREHEREPGDAPDEHRGNDGLLAAHLVGYAAGGDGAEEHAEEADGRVIPARRGVHAEVFANGRHQKAGASQVDGLGEPAHEHEEDDKRRMRRGRNAVHAIGDRNAPVLPATLAPLGRGRCGSSGGDGICHTINLLKELDLPFASPRWRCGRIGADARLPPSPLNPRQTLCHPRYAAARRRSINGSLQRLNELAGCLYRSIKRYDLGKRGLWQDFLQSLSVGQELCPCRSTEVAQQAVARAEALPLPYGTASMANLRFGLSAQPFRATPARRCPGNAAAGSSRQPSSLCSGSRRPRVPGNGSPAWRAARTPC